MAGPPPDAASLDSPGGLPTHTTIMINARIENIFNEGYVEADGFGVPGTSAYVGLAGQIGL